MSKKKLTKHIWYGSDTVMSEGKLQAAPPPVAIDDGTKEWHLSGLTRGELFVNDYAGDPALFILASDNKVRRIGGQGSGSGGEGGGGDFSLAQGPGIEIKSDINNIYTISHKDTSSQESINKTKKKGIASVLLDDFGHVTGLDTCDILDLEDLDKRYLRKDINDEAAGEIIFDKKIGSSIFLDGMDGKGWEIKADGSGIMEALKVRSDIYAGNKIGSISFAPGFTGWGTEIDIPTATGTFDNIFVRKTFTAYEIVYSQIYGLGSSQIVSDINKIGRVERLSDRWRCNMDDMDGLMLMNLREGDGVRIQRRNGITSTKYLFGRCIGISSDYFDVAYPLIEGTGEPEAGDFAMRWGNDRDTTRQGLIYLTSADQGAPFIAVYDGITGVSTQDTLKAQLGNLSMIRTKNGTQLKGYGAYLNGIYIENSSIYLDNGMTVEQQFSVMNGELRSEIEGVRNDMSLESGNILVNSTFGKDTNYWRSENEVHFINVGGDLLWIGGAFYSEKREVADIYRDGDRNVLRLLGTTIYQSNANMKGDKAAGTYSYAFFYKVMRRGVLTVGFAGQELYDSLTLDPSDEYVKLSKAGKWDGTGDFRIGFTGEILIYGVSLFNDRLADAVIKLETRILQTEEYIKLLATKDYVDSETGKIYEKYTGELSVMATEIAARVTHTEFDTETAAIRREVSSALTVQDGKISGISTDVNNIQNTIDTAGWINTTQGNALFAAKSLENGDNIISYINQTATTTTIKAERIDLVGVVTISMLDSDLRDTINDTVSDVNKASDITSAFYRFSNDGMSLNRRIEVGSGSIDNLSVKGGISPDVNNVCFWTGGTYGQAVNNEAKIVLRHDGAGFLANKNISWNTSGDLSIIGKIQTSDNGNRIIIDPSTRSIRMINDKNSLTGEILFNDMTGYQSLPAFHIYMRNASSGVSNYRVSMGYFGFGSYDNGGNVLFNISPSGLMTFPYMSTVDPKVKGAIWRDGNMLKISLG